VPTAAKKGNNDPQRRKKDGSACDRKGLASPYGEGVGKATQFAGGRKDWIGWLPKKKFHTSQGKGVGNTYSEKR